MRLLLYRSQYHFFDLKTVMRQYVQDDAGRAYLRTDDTTVPRSDRALASFHFLIEQKMRNHCFVGRDYANESLQNCIFSVFDDLYSLEPQQVSGSTRAKSTAPSNQVNAPRNQFSSHGSVAQRRMISET